MFETSSTPSIDSPCPSEDSDSSVHRLNRERVALEGYQSGKLSRYEVQVLLGFDNRYDTEDWLGRRGATSHYRLQDLQEDRDTLDRLFPG